MKSKLTYLVSIITTVSVSGCVDPNAQQGKGAGGGLGPLIFLPLMILVFWLNPETSCGRVWRGSTGQAQDLLTVLEGWQALLG